MSEPVTTPAEPSSEEELAALRAEWDADCQKWRGRILTGEHTHWCFAWDGLPMDETCPEFPCDCFAHLRVTTPAPTQARLEARRAEKLALLKAEPDGCSCRYCCRILDWLKGFDEAAELVRGAASAATPEPVDPRCNVSYSTSTVDRCVRPVGHRFPHLTWKGAQFGGGSPLPASVSEGPTADPRGLQSLVNDLFDIFTKTPTEIAQQFGESRCTDDHCRINYALELMEGFVTEDEPAALPPVAPPSPETKP